MATEELGISAPGENLLRYLDQIRSVSRPPLAANAVHGGTRQRAAANRLETTAEKQLDLQDWQLSASGLDLVEEVGRERNSF